MDNLAQRLKDVYEAGVYRLSCQLDELRAAVAGADFALFESDLSMVHGKGEFLAAVAQAIKAPGWFGANWDALADALGDLSWQPAEGYVLLLRNGNETFGMTAEEYKVAEEILANTVSFWKYRGKPFWILFC